jgi:hypothetical protein
MDGEYIVEYSEMLNYSTVSVQSLDTNKYGVLIMSNKEIPERPSPCP